MFARLALVGVALGATLLTGCAAESPRPAKSPTLAEAAMDVAKLCVQPHWVPTSSATPSPRQTYEGLTFADGGHTVLIDSQDANHIGSGMHIADAGCMLRGMKVPESIISRISRTRVLDGQQTDSWDNKKISWSYHELDGLFVTVSEMGPALTSD